MLGYQLLMHLILQKPCLGAIGIRTTIEVNSACCLPVGCVYPTSRAMSTYASVFNKLTRASHDSQFDCKIKWHMEA